MRGRLLVGLFLSVFGLILLLAGLGFATLGARQASAAADRAERLRPLSEGQLEDAAIGQEALAEGQIDARTPAQARDFVAYFRQEYQGSDDDGDKRWTEDERRTPPLLLRVADGAVIVQGAAAAGSATDAAGRYRLEGTLHTWQEDGALQWSGFSGEGTKRYYGLRAGDAAMAVGTVVAGREGRVLAADLVYGGTRAGYIEAKRAEASFAPWFGAIFMALGAISIGIGAWQFRRR